MSAQGSADAIPTCSGASPAGPPPDIRRSPTVLLTLEFQVTVDRHMALRVETCTALLRQDLLRGGMIEAGSEFDSGSLVSGRPGGGPVSAVALGAWRRMPRHA